MDPELSQLVLAMDTSGDVCSVAAMRDGRLVSEHIFRHGMHLSERLLDHVTAVLGDANASPADVALYGVGIGPGSFTGTRIGVMTLKTFASLLNRPIYGIDSLAAMAQSYSGVQKTLIMPMYPCRAGSVYAGLYDVSSGHPVDIQVPAALSIADLAAAAVSSSYTSLLFCGIGSVKYRDEMEAALGVHRDRAVFGGALFPRSSDIAAMAYYRSSAGIEADDPLALVPHYVSPPPITMPKTAVK